MAVLTREAILAALDLPQERLHVKPWGGEVILQGMDGVARDEYERQILAEREAGDGKVDPSRQRARLVAFSIVDESGARLFSLEDVEALGKKNGRILGELAAAAMRVNALGEGDIEALAKN